MVNKGERLVICAREAFSYKSIMLLVLAVACEGTIEFRRGAGGRVDAFLRKLHRDGAADAAWACLSLKGTAQRSSSFSDVLGFSSNNFAKQALVFARLSRAYPQRPSINNLSPLLGGNAIVTAGVGSCYHFWHCMHHRDLQLHGPKTLVPTPWRSRGAKLAWLV